MKKIVLSALALACSGSSLFSQVVLQENFTSPFNFAGSGWIRYNLSTPIGNPATWFLGNTGYFNSFNGANGDYLATGWSAGSGTAQISAWLMTPTVTIVDGAVLQFATRRAAASTSPDRLQIRMSTAGSGTTIPSGATSVGPFTDLMLEINPLQSTSTTSAVSSGSVNGYPAAWTVYTVQVSGVPVPTTGRFAFRYFVQNGGPLGTSSDYIGLDAVRYSLPPCMPVVMSHTICSGMSTTLNVIGAASSTYSWNNGATTSSIVVNPVATTVYSVLAIDNGVPCPVPVTATVTVGSGLGVNITNSAMSNTVCAGTTLTLTAATPPGTSSYVWSTGSNAPSLTVAPAANASPVTYSVASLNGACAGTAAIVINVVSAPSLSFSTNTLCLGGSITFSFSGAQNYYFLNQSTNPFTTSLSTVGATVAGVYNVNVTAIDANGCLAGGTGNMNVNPLPVVTTSVSKSAECVGKTVTVTASGASTYSWSGAATSTNAAFTYSSATTGVKSFTVVGTATTGCSATATRTLTISACTGIDESSDQSADISFFPNPFNAEVSVRGLTGRVEVYNALGQIVISSIVGENATLNTAELSKGIYIIKAIDVNDTVIKTQRILKN